MKPRYGWRSLGWGSVKDYRSSTTVLFGEEVDLIAPKDVGAIFAELV